MALRVALRSLAVQPVRSAVLACGFGSGIAAMAGLLGIGAVILEQSRSPHLAGGGDLVIHGANGEVGNARFLASGVLGSPPLRGQVAVAAPSISETLYLVEDGSEPLRLFVRGGIPSLERELGDYETSGVDAWQDTADDRGWADPDPAEILRSMDRFHEIPDVAERRDSWAEWLYFNGRASAGRFYLTFLVGARDGAANRSAGVRLQLERDGELVSYSDRGELSDRVVLEAAPDLTIGRNEVRLVGLEYRIRLRLWREGATARLRGDPPDLTGELLLEAVPGRSMPPYRVRGKGGWLSGYTVPVLSGPLSGSLEADGGQVSFDGGSGYHDHNWGHWEGVTWRWGQVSGDEMSFVYGRILPPADVVDPARLPGFLVALGPDGPLGFSTRVTIEETGAAKSGAPTRIVVRGDSDSLDIEMELEVEDAIRTRGDADFLQLRATYRVRGRVGERVLDFTAEGSAETFRRVPPPRPDAP